MPCVPEALPRITPEAFFETSSEHATCSRVPSGKPSLPDSSRAAKCPRMPLRENPSESHLSLPPVPECLSRVSTSGSSLSAPRVPTAFSSPLNSRKSNKLFGTSKIHRNSGLNRKNSKPIFTVSFWQDLTNKIDRS